MIWDSYTYLSLTGHRYDKLFGLFFREKETEILKDQIDKLNSAITKEEEKAKELEVKARYIMLDKSLFVHYAINNISWALE